MARATMLLLCTMAFLLVSFLVDGASKRYLEYTASAGATVEFACKDTHAVFDVVRWRRNDTLEVVAEKTWNETDKPTYNKDYSGRLVFKGKGLIISDCQGVDHGFYFCETLHNGVKLRGGYYKFVVEEKPKCARSVTDVNVLNGTSALLPCLVRGEPEPTVVWRRKVGQFDFVKLPSRFTPTSSGLKIDAVRRDDAGVYMVTLKNSLGISKKEVNLHVQTRDAIKPNNYYNTKISSTIMLNCEEYTIQKDTTIQWIDSSGSDATHLDRFQVLSNGSLVIQDVRLSDDGLYTCKKRTKTEKGIYWLHTVLVYLDVLFAPQITDTRRHVTAYKNSHVLIPCVAKGNPQPRHRWFLAHLSEIKNTKKYEIFTNGSLLIRNIELSDVSNYTCTPYNSVGTTNATSSLSVIVPPFFTGELEPEIQRRPDDHVNVKCVADGLPKPTVSWSYLNVSAKLAHDAVKVSDTGDLVVKNIRHTDAGLYVCTAKSSAGKSNRQVKLIVLDKPSTPSDLSVITSNGTMMFSWQPQSDGGAEQSFEVWYRASYKTDYDWSSVATFIPDYRIHMDDTDVAGESDVSFYCSVRARNRVGYSAFTQVVKTAKLIPQGSPLRSTPVTMGLSDIPLSPYQFTVEIMSDAYTLQWEYLPTPGRPVASKFLIEYRERNSTTWMELEEPKTRVRRSSTVIKGEANVVNVNRDDLPSMMHPLLFQVSSMTSDDVRSHPATPTIIEGRKISIVDTGSSTGGVSANMIPPIVMAIIFVLFTVILIIGLYCYCNRKKKRMKSFSEDSKINLVADDANNLNSIADQRNSVMKSDNQKPQLPLDYKRFHLRSCPALKLGESNQSPGDGDEEGDRADDAFVLLQPNPKESLLCTCSKNMVSVNTVRAAKPTDKRSLLFKSSSMPNVLSAVTDSPDSVTSDLLDKQDFGIDDVKKNVGNSANDVLLQRNCVLRDSFDKFCRSESTIRRPKLSDVGTLTKLPEVEDPAVTVDENAETKSNRSNKSIDRKSSGFGDGESSTSDPDSLGLDSLGTPVSPLKNDHSPLRLLDTPSKKDTGYFSDVPANTRASPLLPAPAPNPATHFPPIKHKAPCQHSGYFSEDESLTRGSIGAVGPYRPLAPPPYNQAIIDIERMSESTNGDVESECQQLLELERQMGVKLDDSIDDHLDKRHIDPHLRFQNSSSYRDTGYLSDIGGGSIKARYSTREKNLRCAQLLNEYKHNKHLTSLSHNKTTVNEIDVISNGFDPKQTLSTLRSISLMESVINEELPPLKRTNSTGNSPANSCNEWLV